MEGNKYLDNCLVDCGERGSGDMVENENRRHKGNGINQVGAIRDKFLSKKNRRSTKPDDGVVSSIWRLHEIECHLLVAFADCLT